MDKDTASVVARLIMILELKGIINCQDREYIVGNISLNDYLNEKDLTKIPFLGETRHEEPTKP